MYLQIINNANQGELTFSLISSTGAEIQTFDVIQNGQTDVVHTLHNTNFDGMECWLQVALPGSSSALMSDVFTYSATLNTMIIVSLVYEIEEDKVSFLPISERIDRVVAIDACAAWRQFYTAHFNNGDPALPVRRGFFIPIEDLKALAEIGRTGARCYFAMQDNDIKLLLVPVIIEPDTGLEADMLIDRTTTVASGISTVFNFTSPCPSRCDQYSPLYS